MQGFAYIAPGGLRDGDDPPGAQQSAAQQEAAKVHVYARTVFKEQAGHVVYGHHVGLHHEQRNPIQGYVY